MDVEEMLPTVMYTIYFRHARHQTLRVVGEEGTKSKGANAAYLNVDMFGISVRGPEESHAQP
jgi:hypothetical protein